MPDRASAQAHVDALWKEHPGATHICWALLAGGQSAAVDDGEPGGTAGRPMLDVLRHQDPESVQATVVRYFGGVAGAAAWCVRTPTPSPRPCWARPGVALQRLAHLHCSPPYALEGAVRRERRRRCPPGERRACQRCAPALHAARTAAPALVQRLADLRMAPSPAAAQTKAIRRWLEWCTSAWNPPPDQIPISGRHPSLALAGEGREEGEEQA